MSKTGSPVCDGRAEGLLTHLPFLPLPAVQPPTTAHSSTTTHTMQALHALQPQMLPTYHRQNINAMASRNPNTSMIPVPSPSMAVRKRKRAHQYSVNYSEVKETDHEGRTRDVIVIDDTPPPPATASPATTRNSKPFSTSYQPPVLSAPIRTRARAAMEAQTSTSSSTSTTVGAVPVPKKRKREVADDVSASARKPAPGALQHHNGAVTTTWPASNTTDSVSPAQLLPVRGVLIFFSKPRFRNRRHLATTRRDTTSLFQTT